MLLIILERFSDWIEYQQREKGIIEMLKFLAACSLCGFLLTSANAEMPDTIDILYVKAPFNLQNIVMKKHNLLEKEFAKDNVKINWIPLTQGGKQGQALASNSAQVTSVMNFSSLVLANANGNPIKVIAGVGRPSELFGLVTLSGMKPTQGAEVTVGGPKGTALHQLLADYLNKEKVPERSVHFIGMSQQAALTALLTGRVDCALLGGALLEKAKQEGAKEIANAKDFTGVNLVMAVSKDFAEKYPEALDRIANAQDKAVQWINENKQEAVKVGVSELGIPEQLGSKLASAYHYYSRLNTDDIAQLEKTQKFLKDYGFIKKTVPVEEIVLPVAKEK